MLRVASVIGIAAALVATVGGSAAARSAPPGKSHTGGIVLARHSPRIQQSQRFFRTSNLVYHSGGSVQTGTHHTYAIYWGADSTFPDGNYQSLVNGYFQNVAAASGSTSNVYANDTQYYQTIGGTTTHISYAESFVSSYWDQSNPTSSGCSSTAGGRVACVSDSQIQSEVLKAIHANNWPEGTGNQYFVFLGDGISTCSGSSCFVSQFCAYHGDFTDNGQTVLYANMPYTGYNLSACGSGQYPNNDPAADSTINVTSHEANETITDDLLNAWYDNRGYEIGDKCAWNFGISARSA